MLQVPSTENLQIISNKLGFRINPEDLSIYKENTTISVERLNEGLKLGLINHSPSSYANARRNFGYRPKSDENPYNAWYWICRIQSNNNNGILSGKKLGIKDNIAVAGVPMMDGSMVLEGFVPFNDATVVQRVLDAGGEVYGKTTCEDLCISCASYCTTYGPVKNPLDSTRTTGGSSSGNAAALLIGDIDMALGTDQGGSVRMPSSTCGLVGLKPTFGLVPYTGVASMSWAFDHVGPMARTVQDCAFLLEAVAGFDDCKDSRQPTFQFEIPKYSQEIFKPTNNLRLGVLNEGFDVCDEDVIKCVRNAISKLETSQKFASITAVNIPTHKEVDKSYNLTKLSGFYHQCIKNGGLAFGSFGYFDEQLTEKLHQGVQARPYTLHPNVKKACIIAAYHEQQGVDNQLFARGSTLVHNLRKGYDKAFESVDLLICPTLPHTASKIQTEDNLRDYLHYAADLLPNVKPFNATHHPALSLNCGLSEKTNLPVGLQIIGKLWHDSTVLQAAFQMEKLFKSS